LIVELKSQISLEQLIKNVRSGLKLDGNEIRLVIGNRNPITKIGLCAGAGGDYLQMMIDNNCQVFITGDIKYHVAMQAKDAGITLVDPGHFGSEKFFAHDFAKQLSTLVGTEVEIFESKFDQNPFTA
jgi:GTP cyclohydrolase I